MLLGLAAAACGGCASTDNYVYDATPRARVSGVMTFQGDTRPDRPYKLIATYTRLDSREAELKVQKQFVHEACLRGADGMLFSYSYAGERGGWGAINKNGVGMALPGEGKFLFRADIFVYTAETNAVAKNQ